MSPLNSMYNKQFGVRNKMFSLPISIATHTCVQGHPERMIKSMGLFFIPGAQNFADGQHF